MAKRTRRLIFAAVVVVLGVAVGLRIHYVDSHAVHQSVEHYSMGQWVDLNGAFLENKEMEDTQGYSIKVDGASVMSYNDYIRTYGKDPSQVKPGFDTKSILVLKVELKNKDNKKGLFNLFGADLVPARKNNYLIFDGGLWHQSEPNQNQRDLAVRLEPNTSYTTNIPYEMNLGNTGTDAKPLPPLKDTSFDLIVSNEPVRKVIDIHLSGA